VVYSNAFYRKAIIGTMAINKAESFFDDMKVHDIPVGT
jgi:hypothetical protein